MGIVFRDKYIVTLGEELEMKIGETIGMGKFKVLETRKIWRGRGEENKWLLRRGCKGW